MLNAQPGVRDSAVVGAPSPGRRRGARPRRARRSSRAPTSDAIVRARQRAARRSPEDPRARSVWPAAELPRTEGTRKLKRAAIREWAAGERRRRAARGRGDATRSPALVARYAGPRRSRAEHDARGARPELARARRADGGARGRVPDTHRRERASRAGRRDLAAAARARRARGVRRRSPPTEPVDFPAWNRSLAGARASAASACRRGSCRSRASSRGSTVDGLEHLDATRRARSSSPPTTRATWTRRSSWRRCPRGWRYRVAPAMAKEFFKAHFFPEQYGRDGVVHQQPQLLPRRRSSSTRFRCRSARPARGRRCATSARCSATASRC